MSPIPAQLLEEAPGTLVHLFDIDMTPISVGAPTIYITPATESLAEIARDGQTYTACPVEAEGFERGGTGALPEPTLTVANVAQLVSAWVEGAQDMLGALVTRTVVLGDWLDGAPGADPTAAISVDTYEIARKTMQNKLRVSFSLRSPLERRKSVPFRKALQTCSHSYRTYNPTTGFFVQGTCPYTGAAKFDFYNAPTVNFPKDFCPRTLAGCRARFTDPLPFRGFPGLA